MDVGFIGLGRMGVGMAANLLKAGHTVRVYNRTPGKADGLLALGALAAASPAEACRGGVVITMLANDAAVEDVVHGPLGVLAGLGAAEGDALHISCSTIGVALSRRLAAAHADRGQRYVAAPVFGRPEAAAAGQLVLAVGGAAADIARVQPLFDAVGRLTQVFSEQPEHANLVKLSGNFLIASVIESLGEALALVGKGGVDGRQYVDFLTATLFNAPIYKTYGAILAERAFSPAGFAAPLGLKDVSLTLAAADELRVPLPLASLLRDRFLRLLAEGGEALDWSAIGSLAARDSGQG